MSRKILSLMDEEQPSIAQAIEALKVYGDLAGAEALARAMVAERMENYGGAFFWASVFMAISSSRELASVRSVF